ncbi:MAG: hypothetical protein IJX47_04505 [Clostridia bacterium]|nr:hypothetical protein [Clostridia bacterium]
MKEYKELTYNDLPDEVDIVGISFRTAGKIYYFASGGVVCREGEHAIVETARGAEYGIVSLANHLIPKKDLVLPLRSIIRVATPEDDERFIQNAKREEEAYAIAVKKIAEHELEMKLVDVEYTFDNSKLLFYFTADDRVDFRDLVKDLASVFRTRIELRQIGIRDEAKMMGGLGICGREFCCHSFLGDFAQVTIKMAKEQNLSLNAAKISGACGKLMCCLRYEHESYQQEIALTPKADSRVTTPDGPGTVVSTEALKGICVVRLDNAAEGETVRYHRDLLNQPGNPEKAPVTSSPRPDSGTRASHTERGSKSEPVSAPRSTRNAPRPPQPERRETAVTEQITAVESSEQFTQSGERRGGRGGHGRGDRRKRIESRETHDARPENRPETKPVEEKRPEQKPEKKSGSDRRDRTPQKPNRPEPKPAEKKSESKFDVKFAGGQMPDAPRADASRAEDGKSENRSSGRHRPNHRRGGRSGEKNAPEKNSEKKPQKTENNN